MLIHPEVLVTPDCPTIKFRQPREQINLEVELPRILTAQGWGCGTYFHVQFISHDKTKLLSSTLFVVTEEVEELATNEANPYQPMTKTVFNRKAERISNWWENGMKELSSLAPKAKPEVTREPVTVTEVVKRRGRPPKVQQPQPA